MQKRVTFSIDENLVPILERVAKKHNRTQSGIVEDYLRVFLPILDKENPKDVIKDSFTLLGDGISDLFSDLNDEK